MNILFVTSELTPFAKVGGVGDVSAALPRALAERGHDVRVVVPLYARARKHPQPRTPLPVDLTMPLGAHRITYGFDEATLPGADNVRVYFVRCPAAYDRDGIYTQDGDEHLRFALLSHAAMKLAQLLAARDDWRPHVVHANDWQTGLLPLAVRSVYAYDRVFQGTKSVLTIHNIGHQGTFGAFAAKELGLDGALHHLHQEQLGQDRVSFLLTGVLYADAITTVSPTYAREILTPEHGVGLDPFLRGRRDVLFGILNGIDTDVWDPAADPHLPAPYGADDMAGKAACKQALCEVSGLPYHPDVPVIGVVSRLAWQKGFDLCEQVLPAVLGSRPCHLVVLGTGEPRYEHFFAKLAAAAPARVTYHRAFSEPLAHLIEAGADLFLMPSRYEPCGLNQLYSLRYGTPPIVHRTGGLADTVRNWNPRAGTGTGFVFDHFSPQGLGWALHYALDSFRDGRRGDGAEWRTLLTNGMTEDLGWERRVGDYEAIYRQLVRQ